MWSVVCLLELFDGSDNHIVVYSLGVERRIVRNVGSGSSSGGRRCGRRCLGRKRQAHFFGACQGSGIRGSIYRLCSRGIIVRCLELFGGWRCFVGGGGMRGTCWGRPLLLWTRNMDAEQAEVDALASGAICHGEVDEEEQQNAGGEASSEEQNEGNNGGEGGGGGM